MVKFICEVCKYKDTIEWGIQARGLVDMIVNFNCSNCGAPHVFMVIFPSDKQKKLETNIKKVTKDYIG